MSSITWTASALRSEQRPLSGVVWRVVEAQHRASTTRITDSGAAQRRLEELLEVSKPPYPPGCAHLHYLLKSPFRYRPNRPFASRFRRPYDGFGAFYAAEQRRTALAESAFYRLLFMAGAPGASRPTRPVDHTLFSVRYRAERGLDLTLPRLDRDADLWRQLEDYSACHHLAERAVESHTEAIRYASVRDMQGGCNVALLATAAFAKPRPLAQESWKSHIHPHEVMFYRAARSAQYTFPLADFAGDSRLAPVLNRAGDAH